MVLSRAFASCRGATFVVGFGGGESGSESLDIEMTVRSAGNGRGGLCAGTGLFDCNRVCGSAISDLSSSCLADAHLPVPNALGCRPLSGDGEGALCSKSESDDSSSSSLRRAIGCCLPFLRGVLLGDECFSDFRGDLCIVDAEGRPSESDADVDRLERARAREDDGDEEPAPGVNRLSSVFAGSSSGYASKSMGNG